MHFMPMGSYCSTNLPVVVTQQLKKKSLQVFHVKKEIVLNTLLDLKATHCNLLSTGNTFQESSRENCLYFRDSD